MVYCMMIHFTRTSCSSSFFILASFRQLIVAVDKRTGMLPIEMATKQNHSKTIVYDLLRRDLPIDMKEKASAKVLPHQHSWNHLVSQSNDVYHDVVSKVLQQCSQPQILALANVENKSGEIALATATPLCKHEFRIMFRLFYTLEVVDTTPAFTNVENGTQIFYALRYAPPPEKIGYFTSLYQDDKSKLNQLEPWDNSPVEADDEDVVVDITNMNMEKKLAFIKNEKGTRVIAKLTSRSDIVEAEMSKRDDYQLSRHYVPAIISVHHTIQHAAYSEAMAEPSYCITMEGAEITAENLLLDVRRNGGTFPKEALKSIAISLLHIHDRGLVHGDFGSHNVARFGNNRWKVLGIGGSIDLGVQTDPKRGFFHPPEAVTLETRNVSLGEKNVGAAVVSIESAPTYDIWAYGTIVYEALAGLPLSPYRSAYKTKRAMTTAELFKVGQWDERTLRKALRHVARDEDAQDLIRKLLHPNPESRLQSMREALEHPFFGLGKIAESSSFSKRTSQAEVDTVELKMYTDEYMEKHGIVEQDIQELFNSPMKLEDSRLKLEGSMPAVEEEPPNEEKEQVSTPTVATPKALASVDVQDDPSSPQMPPPKIASPVRGNVASTIPSPAKPPAVVVPPEPKEVVPAPPQALASSAQADPPQPLSQPDASKSKSKFGMKGLKFGKKSKT